MRYTAIDGHNYKRIREDIKTFVGERRFIRPVMDAKIFKVLPHQFMDVEWSLWTDVNMNLTTSIEELQERMGDADMLLLEHPEQRDIYAEGARAIKCDKGFGVKAQLEKYKKAGVNPSPPLFMASFILRKHTPAVEAFNNAWWGEICTGSARDQISLPVTLEKSPVKIKTIPVHHLGHDSDGRAIFEICTYDPPRWWYNA